jgi:hypothetical protein
MNDVRFAFRQLRNSPASTVTALATIAICLGAHLAIFAVIDSILLRPLPFPESDRLVTIFNTYPNSRSRARRLLADELLRAAPSPKQIFDVEGCNSYHSAAALTGALSVLRVFPCGRAVAAMNVTTRNTFVTTATIGVHSIPSRRGWPLATCSSMTPPTRQRLFVQ